MTCYSETMVFTLKEKSVPLRGSADVDISSAKVKELAEELQRLYQRESALRAAQNALVLAIGAMNDEVERVTLQKEMHRTFLKSLGIDTAKLLADVEVPDTDRNVDLARNVDAIIRLLMPKKRIAGQELLDFFAREMVRSRKPMTFTDMMESLDNNGYEQPGLNARNNIISLIVKNKHRFMRVGRGEYYVTREEELHQLKEMSDVRDE